MAKLYFRYGTVGSAKTMNLLAVAHNYRLQNKKILLLKPLVDTRFGAEVIKSRAGLTMDADIIVNDQTELTMQQLEGVECLLVDEAQFIAPVVIDQLRHVASEWDVPVICYGLRTDFRTRLFPGSLRLLEVADAIEEIKTTCAFCNKKAIFNLKLVDGTPSVDGPQVDLGTEEKYLPACAGCYYEQVAPPRRLEDGSVEQATERSFH